MRPSSGAAQRVVGVVALAVLASIAAGCGADEAPRGERTTPTSASSARPAPARDGAADVARGEDGTSSPVRSDVGSGSPPTETPPVSPGTPWLVDATSGSGLESFRQVCGRPEKPYIVDSVCGGIAVLDYDGDGRLDVYLTNAAPNEDVAGTPAAPSDALFRNQGDGTFRDVTEEAGLVDRAWTNGVTVADVDADGHPDLYLTQRGPNRLLRNRGDGTFEDVTEVAGVGDPAFSTGAAFFDADGDGDLDLYVANYVDFDPEYEPDDPSACTYRDLMVFYGPKGLVAAPDSFYRNRGDGTFAEVSVEAGVRAEEGYGFQVLTFDADGDGDMDVFVANDSTPNFLWANDGEGRFVDDGLIAGLAFAEAGAKQGSMGSALGDADGDGLIDIYVTNFSEDHFTLYRGEGGGFFSDVTLERGLADPTYPSLGWGCALFDVDDDGDDDILAANGHVYPAVDRLDGASGYRQRNQLFVNERDAGFSDASERAGPGLAVLSSSRGAAFGDLDDDGDIDVVFNEIDGTPTLLRNDTRGGHWLAVELVGEGGNRDAIGAVVVVEAGGARQTRIRLSSSSYLGADDPRLHFGLGEAGVAERLLVRWPDGTEETFEAVEADRFLRVEKGRGIVSSRPPSVAEGRLGG